MFLLHLLKPDLFLLIAIPSLIVWFKIDWTVNKRRFDRSSAFGPELFDTYTQLRIANAVEMPSMLLAWILKWIGFITLFCHVFMAFFAY